MKIDVQSKDLKVNDNVAFFCNGSDKVYEGKVISREEMSRGDIGFEIDLGNNKKMRVKHRKITVCFLFNLVSEN